MLKESAQSVGEVITGLRLSALKAVKELFQDNHMERMIIGGSEECIDVAWLDANGKLHSGRALELRYSDGQLSVRVESGSVPFIVNESSFSLSCYVWLEKIKELMSRILSASRQIA